jgi:hypothetical protein
MNKLTLVIPIFNLTGYRLKNFLVVMESLKDCSIPVVVVQQKSENILYIENKNIKHKLVESDKSVCLKNMLIHEGVKLADTEYIWYCDADVIFIWDNIVSKFNSIQTPNSVYKPFKKIVRLNKKDTDIFLKNNEINLSDGIMRENIKDFGQQSFIVKKSLYEFVGGMDQSIEGGGIVDFEFIKKVQEIETTESLDEIAIHLWHGYDEVKKTSNLEVKESPPQVVFAEMKDFVSQKSPIAIFAYNRPDKLKQLLNSINKENCTERDIVFFVDGGGSNFDQVCEVMVNWKCECKSISYNVNKEHVGLKNSIISGVNSVFDYSESIIVLEDDLILEPNFLSYMDFCLEKYKKDPQVWHVSGYSRGVEYPEDEDVYFHPRPESWGWATWKEKWKKYDENKEIFERMKTDDCLRVKFCNHGSWLDWDLLIRASEGKVDSWAMWWYYTIFSHGGLCVNPKYSLVKCNGFGDDATHCVGELKWNEIIKPYFLPRNFPEVKINVNSYKSRAQNDVKAYGPMDQKFLINGEIFQHFSKIYTLEDCHL